MIKPSLRWLLALSAAMLACATFLPAEPTPTLSPPEPSEPPGDGVIAYLGTDGNLYMVDSSGQNQSAVTEDAHPRSSGAGAVTIYQSPTWSADGRLLAFTRFDIDSGSSTARLMVYDRNASDTLEIFSSTLETPFYLYWSPDSERITFLTSFPGTNDLNLRLAFVDGAESQVLDMGQPYYWVWSPDGAQIFTHVGGAEQSNPEARVAILSSSGEPLHTFDFSPDFFQAPSWSPDGAQLMFGLHGDERGSLVRMDREGTNLQTLAEYEATIAFSWSPDGTHIATLSTRLLTGGFRGTLQVLSSESPGDPLSLVPDTVVAYFWSPDSRKVAYFALNTGDAIDALASAQAQGSSELTLNVLDVERGTTRLLATFEPTRDFLTVIPFFDQYHHSDTIWSPDSRRLVYTAREEGGGQGVWVVTADGGDAPLRVADGSLAFWSWK